MYFILSHWQRTWDRYFNVHYLSSRSLIQTPPHHIVLSCKELFYSNNLQYFYFINKNYTDKVTALHSQRIIKIFLNKQPDSHIITFEIKAALICKLIAKHLEMCWYTGSLQGRKKADWKHLPISVVDNWYMILLKLEYLHKISKPTHIHIPFHTNIYVILYMSYYSKEPQEEQFISWGRIRTGHALYKSSATEKREEHWSFPSGEIDFVTNFFFDWCGESTSLVSEKDCDHNELHWAKTLEIQALQKCYPWQPTLSIPRGSQVVVCRPIVRLRHNPGLTSSYEIS